MPFRKGGRDEREGREKDKESKRRFLGMKFPRSPRARSSSVSVLSLDRDRGKPDGGGDFNGAPNPPGREGVGSSPHGPRMAWP